MEIRLEEVRLRSVYIKHIEERGDRMRRSFVRLSSDTDERRERLRRIFVRPKSEIYEDFLMTQVSLKKRFWNMINP